MKIVAIAALLHLYSSASAEPSAEVPADTVLTAAPGDVALLPCSSGGGGSGVVAPILTIWIKDGQEIARSGAATPEEGQRVAVSRDGSLSIAAVVASDQGNYLCDSTWPDNSSSKAGVLLRVADLTTSIYPATALPNGTLYTRRGSNVAFTCSSQQPWQLTWAFSGASGQNESLNSTSGRELSLRIDHIQPDAQGLYSCRAERASAQQQAASGSSSSSSTELLVYYVPDRHPQCVWGPATDPQHFHFNCSWLGAYPSPNLTWVDEGAAGGQLHQWALADGLSLRLNRSELWDGQTLRCRAQHPVLADTDKNSCSFTFRPPFPEGEPLVTAPLGPSVTLTCSETTSIPPANTTWKKGLQQEDITVGPKYTLSGEGPDFQLTIHNVSKDDEGVYFCRSENPLAVRELEVYLTIRASSAYTGVIIGIFIATLIVGSAAVLAKALYSSRHQICLGNGFGPVDADGGGDVLNLVESDEEHIFQDTVPRLPPVSNGRTTTLVQIHRIPSSDHEDLETADTSAEQPEEMIQTEEPEDLITY